MRLSILSVLLITSIAWAQNPNRELVREGNALYSSGNYAKAEQLYKQAYEAEPELEEADFYKGDALYKQGDLEAAKEVFEQTARNANNTSIKQKAFYNLGNTHLKREEFNEAMEAYKEALKLNPSDENARTNFEYARQKLIQQQQEPQENQDKNEEQEQQQNQDQSQNQDNKEKEENKDQQGENPQDENKDENEQPQQPKGKPSENMSKKDAERLLEALKNEEQKTQENLQKKKAKGSSDKKEKDW